MAATTADTSKRQRSPIFRARVAAALVLLLSPLPVFGMIYVPSLLIVPGDAAATARNALAAETLFRLGIASTLLAQVIGILWALVLYQLLRPVSKNAASLMVIFYLLIVPIAMLNELNSFAVPLLLRDAGGLASSSPDQVNALVSLFLNLHVYGIRIAGIFWGLWLLPYGYLVFRSGFLPRVLGLLLMIGCFGYLIQSFAGFVWPNLDVYTARLSALTSIGELLLPLWLAIRGVNVEKWAMRARDSA